MSSLITEYDARTGDGKFLANSLAILNEAMQMAKPSVWDDVVPEANSDACPKPGIYPGVSFSDYCLWDAVNHSKLCRIDKSPLNCHAEMNLEKSPAIRLGQLVHCGRLEPDAVAARYVVMPEFELMSGNTTKDGKPSTSAGTDFVKANRASFRAEMIQNRREVVSAAEYEAYQNALTALCANREVVSMVEAGQCELSIVWNDRRTGLRCKARLDIAAPDRICDLKTSRDDGDRPLPESFEYAMWTYHYYTQAAFYQDGWEAVTGKRLPFWFAVVGTHHPMQCVAGRVGEVTLDLGREKNRERMSKYLFCKQNDVWPGYEQPEFFELPERFWPEDLKA